MQQIAAVMIEPIPDKEISLAVLGASAALAGILLVYAGLLFARADTFPGEVPDTVTKKFRLTAVLGLIPVSVCAAVMLISYEWLLQPADVLWFLWRWGFWVETVAFIGYAILSSLLLGRS